LKKMSENETEVIHKLIAARGEIQKNGRIATSLAIPFFDYLRAARVAKRRSIYARPLRLFGMDLSIKGRTD
jgi:hypothetical protein